MGSVLASGPSLARPLSPAMPAKCAGAFVDWGTGGRETNLRLWEASLRQPASSVPAIDFYGQATWDDFRQFAWLPAFWAKANPRRKLVWSIPLTVAGTDLIAVGEGLHDEPFRVAVQAIAESQPEAAIRIGWEMNVAGSLWLAANRERDYIRAYRHVVQLFRQASSRFRFDWCPGWGAQAMPADQAYPGDDVVDVVGLDIYDFGSEREAEARWKAEDLEGPFGLTWHQAFARRHRKLMSYPEWGVGQSGDNPVFVQRMADWLLQHSDEIAYALYFNVDGAWPTRIDNGRFPRSADTLRERFSGRG
ncbi:hypothetical protein MMMDOFMJ_2130 [Methylobacterium gnaphalii]|uniref:GH26 domain-containing protein n=2 Tax=Methylobacterium gnaphalii TaxID=1010610 RepID=A0A512JKU3_9HYPH|nr:hypothetical protein MGN01_24160 [Methylobacterium gnaphalii]GJD69203.1 hypothetical protein MMMDOFMJ_2130 [Methylobacterium gnaphalii]GLS47865.1 hypothetical protein GCM10007885_07090 [Methylobacterium gnaphalii]